MRLVEELADVYAWPSRPRFGLDELAKRRLYWTNFLPAILIAASLLELCLTFFFGPEQLYYGREDLPEVWQRVLKATNASSVLLPACVGLLFWAGLRPWRPRESSWMLFIGATLALTAITLGTISVAALALTEDPQLLNDLRIDNWTEMSWRLGFLSLGYFFIAFRAGQATASPGPVRRYRRGRAALTPPQESAEAGGADSTPGGN